MLIAQVTSHLDIGGAEKLVAEISVILEKKYNAKVRVISILGNRGIPYAYLKEHNIEIIELNYNKFDMRIIKELYKYTKDCDIVHAHTYYAQLYCSIVVNKKRLITTEHSTWNRRRDKKVFKYLDYYMYSKYSKIICISEATRNSLVKWQETIKDRCIVINNGIDFKKYSNAKQFERKLLGFTEEDIIFICVGRLEVAKNHKRLIEAFGLIKNENYKLILVGEGSERNNIESIISELNLENRVNLLGNRSDVDQLLKMSDCFILVSTWEGFGLVAVEAIAAELPLILSNVDGLNQFKKDDDAIMLVNPNDINDIYINIKYIGENIGIIDGKKLQKNEYYEKFSIEKMAYLYYQEYEKMIF